MLWGLSVCKFSHSGTLIYLTIQFSLRMYLPLQPWSCSTVFWLCDYWEVCSQINSWSLRVIYLSGCLLIWSVCGYPHLYYDVFKNGFKKTRLYVIILCWLNSRTDSSTRFPPLFPQKVRLFFSQPRDKRK